MTSSADQLQVFLDQVFSGRMEQALELVHPEARFISGRPTVNSENPLHGTFKGLEGAERFFQGFADLLEPGVFEIEGRFSEADQACFYGRLDHIARRTGKHFVSDWALIARFENGLIIFYHFYEDTDALREALL